MDKIEDFIQGNDLNVFILKGYAGTGKTTLIRMLTKWLTETGISYSLHASTGRAAKVLSDATENPVTTVHSLLYTFSGLNQDLDKISHNGKAPIMDETGQLYLVFGMASLKRNNCDNTHVYIIDEASMLSDTKTEMPSQATFGSGQLMHDLFEYDAEAKFIFVGDDCQLPPISGGLSPALSCSYIEKVFSVQVAEATLSDIVRQKNSNDIPLAANGIRKMAMNPPDVYRWAKFHLKGFKNIIIHDSIAEMLDSYISNIKDKGYSSCSMISQSNRKCHIYSKLVRPALGFDSNTVKPGDLLMVTQNNLPSGLMNGDMVTVTQTTRREKRAGMTFLHVEVEELSTSARYSLLLLEDVLYGQTSTGLTQEQQKSLLIDFHKRMKKIGVKQKSPSFKNYMMKDIYLNALRTSYGYVITCHKAQGGEWDDVYLDIPRALSYKPGKEAYQWLYTAITRAKKYLHIVNDYYLG